jgi:pimeloyl-ACP methyl ester carboxylesterase
MLHTGRQSPLRGAFTMATAASSKEHRASNGIFYRVEGGGEPLLLLHGLLATGMMFDPLVELLRDRFCMLIPDLRGHGRSGDLDGPYDVAALAADLDTVLAEARFERSAVMGYSHGGAVAQQLARTRPAAVSKLMLVCTYANNVSTLRERLEVSVFLALLGVLSPATIAKLIVRPSPTEPDGPVELTSEQALWLRSIFAANRRPAMRGAAKGLISFDSRPWLNEIKMPTLVVGGTHDFAVPEHHFKMLVSGIPGAVGQLIARAGHTLAWTHTRELAEIIRAP